MRLLAPTWRTWWRQAGTRPGELLRCQLSMSCMWGYRDRTCLTDEAGERLICPAKNGMFRPIVVSGGRVVAVRAPGGILSFADGGETHAQEARALMKDWENWMSK